MRRVGGLTFCVLLLVSAADAVSVQEALLRSKPGVTLVVAEVAADVTVRCGISDQRVTVTLVRETATAWGVSPNGVFVTSAHVVASTTPPLASLTDAILDAAVRKACLETFLSARGVASGERPELERDLVRQAVAEQRSSARVEAKPVITVVLSNGMKLVARVVKASPVGSAGTMSRRDMALLQVDSPDLPSLPLADRRVERIGDAIYILGFPGVVLKHELLGTSAQHEATVTKGSLSGFREDVNGQPVFQTDAEAVSGNSGGPAVDAEGRVIGMLTFVMPDADSRGDAVQGFNFVIPAMAIREFLAGSGAVANGPGRFDTAWRKALDDFFAGRHRNAAQSLREADRLVPGLPDVRRIAAENEYLIGHPPRRRIPFVALAFAGTSMGAVAAGVLGVLRWRRNRFRITPADVVRLLETSPQPPIILDARSRQTYERSPVRLPHAVHVSEDDLDDQTKTRDLDHDRVVVAYCT